MTLVYCVRATLAMHDHAVLDVVKRENGVLSLLLVLIDHAACPSHVLHETSLVSETNS